MRNKNNDELKLYDDSGNNWTVGRIKKDFIKPFISEHKSGDSNKAKLAAEETVARLMGEVAIGTITKSELCNTVKVLKLATSFTTRMEISTLKKELELILNNEDYMHMKDAI